MSNSSIQIDYNDNLDSLTEVLSKADRPGDFFVSGSLVAPMPRLEIEGVGPISFPLLKPQEREIIKAATQAPYGRGEETVVDTSVRNVWQIGLEKVQLGGKGWPETFASILQRVAQGLGRPEGTVSADLYKLLVYDTGGFFVSHRDTEKAEGMFGTLVIVLPSSHRGGELVVRHAGREVSLDLSTKEVSELTYAAFYADCQHEVLPVQDGSRLCLVYNLMQKDGSKKGSPLEAPDYNQEISTAAAILSEWSEQMDATPKIVFLLEHQYTPSGLSFSALKNADAAAAKVLCEAGTQAGYAAHLGIVHIEETGNVESYYEPRRSRWGRRYGRGYADDDQPSVRTDFVAGEIYESRQFIDHWIASDNSVVDFGKIPIGEGELLPKGALDKEPPDEQRVTEATGNEGATFERSYHRAALVLWTKDRYLEVLLQAGVGAAIPYLKQLVQEREQQSNPSERSKIWNQISALAGLIIRSWPAGSQGSAYSEAKAPDRSEMLRLLRTTGDADLIRDFIQEVSVRHYDGTENTNLKAALRFLEPRVQVELIAVLFQKNMDVFHGPCVELYAGIAGGLGRKRSAEAIEAVRKMSEAAVKNLEQIKTSRDDNTFLDWGRRSKAGPVAGATAATLLRTLWNLDLDDLANSAAAAMLAKPGIFGPDTVLVPAFSILAEEEGAGFASQAAFLDLWKHAADFLLARSEFPPAAPTDWAQPVQFNCACALCKELRQFAADPKEQVHRFRVRQESRSHLQSIIQMNGLDMKHETERIGSPQTLVCTKTRRRYESRCNEYKSDGSQFEIMAQLGKGFADKVPVHLKRVQSAIDRAGGWRTGS